jgi:hypothetical protein
MAVEPDLIADTRVRASSVDASSLGTSSTRVHLTPVLHCTTVFLSAFLLFSVQPLAGRLLLPAFGGAAAVWGACMLFFQVLLLGGYGYADWLSRKLTRRSQLFVHLGLLAACLLSLPIHLNFSLADGQAPALRIPLILALGIGLPYLALSTTSPLVQVWYARIQGKAPYRLYALSNLASLIALISYPTLVEPALTSRDQLLIWSAVFGVFAVLCAASLVLANRAGSERIASISTETSERPGAVTSAVWITLSGLASALLLATTNHLCQNVAAIPFLWIVPLVAYLLTLIFCFDFHSPTRHKVFLWLTPVALVGMAYSCLHGIFRTELHWMILLFTTGLFITCMGLHGELVARKPKPAHLTSFYLMIALGGAAGSAVVVWVAPAVLSGVFELSLLIAATAVFLLFLFYRRTWYTDVVWAVASIAAVALAHAQVRAMSDVARISVRNFYGSLRIVDTVKPPAPSMRAMVHGTINHGMQYLDPARRGLPTSYYAKGSGVQIAIDELAKSPMKVGIIGLGAGALAAYSKPGDLYVFYELNPQVIQLARSEFTFLGKPGVEAIEADGRLGLERDQRTFDMLVLDAFSGDAIPVHLLTAEAMQVYWRRLQPDGLLVLHISNTVLDLEPPVQKLVETAGLSSVMVHIPGDSSIQRVESKWALIAKSPERLRSVSLERLGRKLHTRPGQRLWTDDYSNLFELVKFDGTKE